MTSNAPELESSTPASERNGRFCYQMDEAALAFNMTDDLDIALGLIAAASTVGHEHPLALQNGSDESRRKEPLQPGNC